MVEAYRPVRAAKKRTAIWMTDTSWCDDWIEAHVEITVLYTYVTDLTKCRQLNKKSFSKLRGSS